MEWSVNGLERATAKPSQSGAAPTPSAELPPLREPAEPRTASASTDARAAHSAPRAAVSPESRAAPPATRGVLDRGYPLTTVEQPEQTWDWDSPFPLGQANAADSAGSVAAALFAGFSLTLIGLIVPDTTKFRWPGVGLLLLALASVLFVASVQCAFWAKEYAINPGDLDAWYGDMSKHDKIAYQRAHQLNFRRWAARMNRSYRLGILALLSGMTVALVPTGSLSLMRGVAIGVIILGFLVELLWIFSTWLLDGSPSIAFGHDRDEPLRPVSFRSIRTSPALRRLARVFVPLARIDVPPAKVGDTTRAQSGSPSASDSIA